MKSILLSISLAFSIGASAQLKINEIMSNNVSAVLDDAYNYSMWVELYNPSTISYDQSIYYFTDDLTQPKKWKPASKAIAPGAFGLLWFEHDNRAGHATFKLEPEGGKLYMLNAVAQVVDSVVYPAQYRNISYGRKTDNANDWTYFEQFSAGASNNSKVSAFTRCAKPVFKLAGGFYPISQDVSFETPGLNETIYYTINGAEPTKTNANYYTPGASITLRITSILRAKSFSSTKLSSDIATSTYFINERKFNLPVVSIVTEQANLTDNTIGIYCDGTNGITGNGQNSPRNYNQEWDRPVNYELIDTTGVVRLNQELDIAILGAWTRANGQKSIAIQPKKKFGNNRLRYDIFGATKPNMNYKDIQMRNSGNDFGGCMMRDAFMQSLIMKRMDLDYQAYEPAVIFMNGVYFGIQNLRERTNADFMYSNFGLDDDKVTWIEATNNGAPTDKDIPTDPGFVALSNLLKNSDISTDTVYKQVCSMMDVDEFANYMMAEIFYANNDWPNNNTKMWKTKENGKWRWLLFDTDFGFSNASHNTLTFALGENLDGMVGAASQPDWATVVLRRLILNETFRNKLIDRYCIHLSTTFETNRINHIMDSLSAKIASEIVYHKAKWGGSNFASVLSGMKSFAISRSNNMLSFIDSRFLGNVGVQTLKLSANISGASYKLNSEPIIDASLSLKYYKNRPIALQANLVTGYTFKQWEFKSPSTATPVTMASSWMYFDGNAIPAANWNVTTYSDAAWKTGTAPLGYGGRGETTTIGYGGVATNKYPTAYFRKTVSITDLASKSNFTLTTLVDDGAAVYVNGTEIGRNNMPTGTLLYTTIALTTNNGVSSTYTIPANLLKEGDNVIAVEVHQGNVTSSDLVFDLQLSCDVSSTLQVVTSPILNTTLTKDVEVKAIYEVSTIEDLDAVPAIVINEVVSGNTLIADEFAGKDDYIELYNNGTTDVNIAGWYLSDTPANRTLWQMPATNADKTTIPAKGRIILWADDQTVQGVQHLGLKLGKDGESIMLYKTNSKGALMLVDSVAFPAMESNLSYSRVPDGTANWKVQATSFNLTNDGVSAVELPTMSNIRIYPTLVTEALTVQNAAGSFIRITDLTGKVLFRSECKSEIQIIPVAFLQRGMYVISVGNNAYKIVKL